VPGGGGEEGAGGVRGPRGELASPSTHPPRHRSATNLAPGRCWAPPPQPPSLPAPPILSATLKYPLTPLICAKLLIVSCPLQCEHLKHSPCSDVLLRRELPVVGVHLCPARVAGSGFVRWVGPTNPLPPSPASRSMKLSVVAARQGARTFFWHLVQLRAAIVDDVVFCSRVKSAVERAHVAQGSSRKPLISPCRPLRNVATLRFAPFALSAALACSSWRRAGLCGVTA
jgi:hypothetical protein